MRLPVVSFLTILSCVGTLRAEEGESPTESMTAPAVVTEASVITAAVETPMTAPLQPADLPPVAPPSAAKSAAESSTPTPAPTRMGLGLSFGPGDIMSSLSVIQDPSIAPVTMLKLHVPIHVSGMLLEPMFTILRTDYSTRGPVTLLKVGLTAAATRMPDAQTLLYGGGRVELFSYPATSYDSSILITVGVVVGAEYYLSPHFSLGAEGQLNAIPSSELGSFLGQSARLFLRFYQ